MKSKILIIPFTAILFIIATTLIYSQDEFLDNSYLSGAKKMGIDTLEMEKASQLADESSGLLEKEIEPDKYLLGPNDVLEICIMSAKPKLLKARISPDGNVLVPEIGLVALKGKTLAEGIKLIKRKATTIFSNTDVSIVLKQLRQFKVSIAGDVKKSLTVPATAVDRVSEIIDRAGGLKYTASLRKIKIIRNSNEVIHVDLVKYNLSSIDDANPTVLGGDHIIVPTSSMNETIRIDGDVPHSGVFEFVSGDSLSTLFHFAYGFFSSSFLDSVEFSRYNRQTGTVDRKYINLSHWRDIFDTCQVLKGDFPLQSGDQVYIRQIPNWFKPRYVVLKGEVQLPGKYSIMEQRTTVRDVIMRSGGITDIGSLEGAILFRQKEMNKIDREMERLRNTPYSEMSENERRYFQARITEQKGVMAIDFTKIMQNPDSEDNILLVDQDSIFIPQKKLFVNVQGRVNNPGLVAYNPDYTYMDYINMAGGFGFRADDDETLVVKKKGEQFLASDMNYKLEPGDNILVPPETELSTMEALTTTLTIVTQIGTIVGLFIALSR